MARPRSNKLQHKGKGTSFGKQSDAEKSFRKRERKPRFEDPKKSFRPDAGKRNDFRSKSTDSRREEGGVNKRRYSPTARFNQKPGSSFGREDKPAYGDRRGGPRPDREERRDKKPFVKRGDNSFTRPEGPPRFTKSTRSDERYGDKKPFGKRSDHSSHSRPEGPPKFTKSGDDRFKKPFPKSRDNSFRPRREDPPSFSKRDSRSIPDKDRDESRQEGSTQKEGGKKPLQKSEQKSFVQSRVVKSGAFTKTVTRGEPKKDDGLTRLNKYIANSGVGSRREADELIKMGLISVNGTTITELGTKVKAGDVVRYEDRVLKAEKTVYILLNKPKGFITTTEDPQERSTVMGLVAGACKERIYPVGRLDRNTTGLLLLTNDGDLADKLTHPSYKAKKVYKAELDRPITKNDFQKIQEGVHLEEGRAVVDDVAIISDDNKTVGLEIHIGWNRVVRRIFESLGYEVVKLDRSVFAGLDKKDLSRGQWRFLKPEEVVRLKHFR